MSMPNSVISLNVTSSLEDSIHDGNSQDQQHHKSK